MNLVKDSQKSVDLSAVVQRRRVASLKYRAVVWRAALIDAALVFMWLFFAMAPLIGNPSSIVLRSVSPASAALLCFCGSVGPITVSSMRVISVLNMNSKRLRIDRMYGASSHIRYVSFAKDQAATGWWFLAGYFGSALYTVANVLLVALWSMLFGVAFIMSSILLVFTLLSAAAVIGCTSSVYSKGIKANFEKNVAHTRTEREQWARACAIEHRKKWRSKNARARDKGTSRSAK